MRFTAAHWGIYEIDGSGADRRLLPFRGDADPSPIGLSALDAARRCRVLKPAVRRSWLECGWGSHPLRRGVDPFVEIEWEEAIDLAATALRAVIERRGNSSVFGGSYGWSSAGRFHHAQSQVHRFLNALGGYVRHSDSYSLGAARVLMPHVVAEMDHLIATHTTWDVLAAHCRLFVSFGGVPAKNAQISQGMVAEHGLKAGLAAMARAGTRFVNVSPVDTDLETGVPHEWIGIRPNTDTAMLLAIAHTLYTEDLYDKGFVQTHCAGFEEFVPYLLGTTDGQAKTPEWASAITTVPAGRIRELARELSSTRSTITIAWALQRSHHGEQPFWALVTVACMLGQIGLPGGGFGVGYGATNSIGNIASKFVGPTLSQGKNGVANFIPVARLADMLEKPGEEFRYDGGVYAYPDIELVYWAGGNPFHHHQDLNRLVRAWRKKPAAVIVNEQFWTPAAKMADLVLPATTTFEREDIGYARSERYMVAMSRVHEPLGESLSDYEIFSRITARLGNSEVFTEGLDERQWLRRLYDEARVRARAQAVAMPEFDEFWDMGLIDLKPVHKPHVMLEDYRADPDRHKLPTPSGRIEIHSKTIAGFGLASCAGHPCWYEPLEWLGSPKAFEFPLHLISDQPHTKLHSQLDHGEYSQGNKVNGREPIMMHPEDARQRGVEAGDVVRVFNERGSCLAGVRLSRKILPGVVKLSTGAWFDPLDWQSPQLEKHGNPNAVTLDIGASDLSQGCAAQTCLVEVEKFEGEPPPVMAYAPPDFDHSHRARGP